MRRLVFLFSFLLVTLAFVQKGSIPVVESSSPVYQGDLILTGNNVTIIEGRFDINGSIVIEENATLILKNAVINFTQAQYYEHNITLRNPVNGNPRFQANDSTVTSNYPYFTVSLFQNTSATVFNTTITSYLYLNDYAVASVSESTITYLAATSYSNVSVLNSTISSMLYANYSPVVSVSNSDIDFLIIESFSVDASFANIRPGFFDFWDHYLNSSVTVAPGGYAPNVTVRNTTIDNWQLQLHGKSNATITNSTLLRLFSYDYTCVWLVNSTAGLFQFTLEGRIHVSWYLHAHVIDSIGQSIPSANVTATYPNATVAESKSTGANGWTRLTLMEKMMNTTGEYPVGNYTLEATYDIYSDDATVNMTENQQITLTLEDFVIPEFPSLLILPLFIIATLLSVILYRRKLKKDTIVTQTSDF